MNSTDTETPTGTGDHANGPTHTSEPARPSDWRPLIVAVVGIVAVLAVAMTAFILLSGSTDSPSSQSQSMVAVASASFTAIGAVTSAYFGIRAANRAREDTQDSRDADVVRAASLAAAQPEAIPEAIRAATTEMGKMKAGRLQ